MCKIIIFCLSADAFRIFDWLIVVILMRKPCNCNIYQITFRTVVLLLKQLSWVSTCTAHSLCDDAMKNVLPKCCRQLSHVISGRTKNTGTICLLSDNFLAQKIYARSFKLIGQFK